jgi:hypothetical protein
LEKDWCDKDLKELCPEIGKVFFHKIRAGIGNVYFGKEMFILGLHF